MRVRIPLGPYAKYMTTNDFGVVISARKHKRRKYREVYKGYGKSRLNRLSRRNSGVTLEARINAKVDPPQGKRKVASNRCGNACGRRAALGDYLCSLCRE
jgi:hypothetical protein